jgi:pyrrolidone-carboxylate peptidase
MLGKMGLSKDVIHYIVIHLIQQDRQSMYKIVACSHNHCCHKNAGLCSLPTVTDLHVAVNNTTPLSVATETKDTTVKLQNIL